MVFEMLYSKIHRATVTDANLNYVGSITIDEELMNAAKLRVGQKVDIVNINNGERFSTYVIKGKAGNRDICLNGAAARKVQKDDKIIIIAYTSIDSKEIEQHKPLVVLLNNENNIELIDDKLIAEEYN